MNSRCNMDLLDGQLVPLLGMHRLCQRSVLLHALVMVASRYARGSRLPFATFFFSFLWKNQTVIMNSFAELTV